MLPEQSTGSATARSGKESGPGCSLEKVRECFVRCVLSIMLFHNVNPGVGSASLAPCFDGIKSKKHADSEMHKGSEQRDAIAAIASAEGGISHAFEKTAALKRKAVLGAMKILYWLSKNEIAHFTKFES